MTVWVFTGTINGFDLQAWLVSEKIQDSLNANDGVHCILEYVHRFLFSGRDDMQEDLKKAETACYGTRGRIFWQRGQIEWRRLYGGEFAIVLQSEDDPYLAKDVSRETSLIDQFLSFSVSPSLKPDAKTGLSIVEARDSDMILWGKYKPNPGEQKYYELRVSGSRPIEYPAVIMNDGREYPVLTAREYLDREGETVLWRFVSAGSKTAEMLKMEKSGEGK